MSVVGLILESHGFKAVELGSSRSEVILKKYGLYSSPEVNLNDSDARDIANYSTALGDFFSEIDFGTRDVVVGIPEREAFVRTIRVPHMTEKELQSSIQFEAEQYIPLPLKDVVLSYQVLEPTLVEKDKMEILLVAARRAFVKKYVDILKKAHLTPVGVEPETVAMSRVLDDAKSTSFARVLVDIKTAVSLIVVTHKGATRLSRSIPTGSDTLTRAIQQELSLDYMQADEYRKTYGLDGKYVEGKVFNALKPAFDGIVSEIKRSWDSFTIHNPNVMIKQVIISGEAALMPGILSYIANSLDIEVELANPWRSVSFSPKLEPQKEKLLNLGPLFVVPVGLALKGI